MLNYSANCCVKMFSQHIYFQLTTSMFQLLIESVIQMQRFHNILTIRGGEGGQFGQNSCS